MGWPMAIYADAIKPMQPNSEATEKIDKKHGCSNLEID